MHHRLHQLTWLVVHHDLVKGAGDFAHCRMGMARELGLQLDSVGEGVGQRDVVGGCQVYASMQLLLLSPLQLAAKLGMQLGASKGQMGGATAGGEGLLRYLLKPPQTQQPRVRQRAALPRVAGGG